MTKTCNLLIALLFWCGTASAQETETTFTVTPEGIGCIKLGMKAADIPQQCEGLYNKVEKSTVKTDSQEDYDSDPVQEQYLFYMGKVKVMEIDITDDDDQTVNFITAYAPHVVTESGLHPGAPLTDLLKLEGVEWQIEGEYYGVVIDGYIAIELKSKYLTDSGRRKYEDVYDKNLEPAFYAKDFKPHGKIEEISVFKEEF